jgi:CBS-domain-containing membrane protein
MTWTVSDVMTRDAAGVGRAAELVAAAVATTTPSTSLAIAASLMFQHRVQLLPVVDPANRPVGIVSRAQLLKVFLRKDEAVRREIVKIIHEGAAGGIHIEVTVTDGLVSLRNADELQDLPRPLIHSIAGVPGVVGVNVEPGVNGRRLEASADQVPT